MQKIDTELVKKIYSSASASDQKVLKKLFGQSTFEGPITDRIKTFEDVEKALGSIVFAKGASPDNYAYEQLKAIAKVLNEGWVPDWNDEDQAKYYPLFQHDGEGFVLHSVHYYCQSTYVGSRLCYKSSELAQYAATQFINIYNAYLQ